VVSLNKLKRKEEEEGKEGKERKSSLYTKGKPKVT
jgi:hypothetical protein